MMIAFFRCCCSFFNFYVLLCCLPFTFHFFTSFSLSDYWNLVRVCCFRLYFIRNFVILCMTFLLLLLAWIETNQFLVYFFFRLLRYIEDAFVCAVCAFIPIRSLSMRCYAHLSLFLLCTSTHFLSLDFMRFASFSMHRIALHCIARTTMPHTHKKLFLIYKLCVV